MDPYGTIMYNNGNVRGIKSWRLAGGGATLRCISTFAPWPGQQPRFKLHEPGADEEELLQGLPSIQEAKIEEQHAIC